ncbi:MAG TPA: hypothetical protein VM686_09905 [Polyangiaceae bacterium]|nr:hypothetical protein [Polyangiaceae bacterium]
MRDSSAAAGWSARAGSERVSTPKSALVFLGGYRLPSVPRWLAVELKRGHHKECSVSPWL